MSFFNNAVYSILHTFLSLASYTHDQDNEGKQSKYSILPRLAAKPVDDQFPDNIVKSPYSDQKRKYDGPENKF